MKKFEKFILAKSELKNVKGGNACQNLDNCLESRHGVCTYSNDYNTCMDNQADACFDTFWIACAQQ